MIRSVVLPLAFIWMTASVALAASRTGTVLVRSSTTGALVIIDDREVGQVPMQLPLALRAGVHTIKVTRPGFSDYLDTFNIKPRQDLVLEIDLLPVTAVLQIRGGPPRRAGGGRGQQLGPLPFEGEVEPGKKLVELRAQGYATQKEEMNLEAGTVYPLNWQLVPLPDELPEVTGPRPWYGHWWVWAGAAAVAAGGVTAVILLNRGEDQPADPPYLLRLRPME